MILCRKVKINDETLFVPFLSSSQRQEKIKTTHEVLGHMAAGGVLDVLKRKYWWPEMKEMPTPFKQQTGRCPDSPNLACPVAF